MTVISMVKIVLLPLHQKNNQLGFNLYLGGKVGLQAKQTNLLSNQMK